MVGKISTLILKGQGFIVIRYLSTDSVFIPIGQGEIITTSKFNIKFQTNTYNKMVEGGNLFFDDRVRV